MRTAHAAMTADGSNANTFPPMSSATLCTQAYMETMYNTRWRMAQSGGTFSCAHRRIQSQKELRLQSRKGSPKPLPPNFVCWLGTLVAPYFGADDAVSTDNGLKAIGFFLHCFAAVFTYFSAYFDYMFEEILILTLV